VGIKISDAQQKQLDALLGELLDAHASGQFTNAEVVGVIAHILTAAAIDNGDEVKSWLEDPAVIKRWKDDTRAHRT